MRGAPSLTGQGWALCFHHQCLRAVLKHSSRRLHSVSGQQEHSGYTRFQHPPDSDIFSRLEAQVAASYWGTGARSSYRHRSSISKNCCWMFYFRLPMNHQLLVTGKFPPGDNVSHAVRKGLLSNAPNHFPSQKRCRCAVTFLVVR